MSEGFTENYDYQEGHQIRSGNESNPGIISTRSGSAGCEWGSVPQSRGGETQGERRGGGALDERLRQNHCPPPDVLGFAED